MSDKKTPDSQLSSSSDEPSDNLASKSDKPIDNKASVSGNKGVSASISLTSSSSTASKASSKAKTVDTKATNSAKESTVKSTNKAPTRTAKKNSASTTNNITAAKKMKTPISKTAVLALLIALAGAGGVGGVHWLLTQQLSDERQAIQQQLTTEQTQTKAQVAKIIEQQSNVLIEKLNSTLNKQASQSQLRIDQLEQQLGRLQQNKSTDWLAHEAEYLIRIASRTLWLEKNTSTVVSLLKDADSQLDELNNPKYLSTRQAIRNDIESLQLLPVIDNESLLLSLSAMSQQVNKLPLAMVKIPDSSEQQADFTLSENTADWRANLAKTWHKFLADFITVRRVSGNVEPLMSPQHQQNLRENLQLKLQVAQWAVIKRQTQVYQQALADITHWLNDYFDTSEIATQHFLQSIVELNSQIIDADYPSSLTSLTAIRTLLAEKPLAPLPSLMKDESETSAEVPSVNSADNNDLTNQSENN